MREEVIRVYIQCRGAPGMNEKDIALLFEIALPYQID